ncbi:MAG: hypothetical protein Q8941_20060 [Bacteroidota bacterium]|nr:hypothetical protein [Bacteroidota bacterium]
MRNPVGVDRRFVSSLIAKGVFAQDYREERTRKPSPWQRHNGIKDIMEWLQIFEILENYWTA